MAFRDIEFDLENDKLRCLYGLFETNLFNPSNVHRVTQLFEKPQFFVDGASANDIVQGALSDTWFLSALATASTAPGLVEKFCVAVIIDFVVQNARCTTYSQLLPTAR